MACGLRPISLHQLRADCGRCGELTLGVEEECLLLEVRKLKHGPDLRDLGRVERRDCRVRLVRCERWKCCEKNGRCCSSPKNATRSRVFLKRLKTCGYSSSRIWLASSTWAPQNVSGLASKSRERLLTSSAPIGNVEKKLLTMRLCDESIARVAICQRVPRFSRCFDQSTRRGSQLPAPHPSAPPARPARASA